MAARWRGDSGGQGPELEGAGHTPGEDAAGATQRPSHEWPWLFGSKYGGRGREAPLGPWLQHCGRPPSRCRRLPVCCVLLAAARLPEHLRERARTLTTAFTGLTAVGPHGSSVPELTGQGSSPRVAASVLTHRPHGRGAGVPSVGVARSPSQGPLCLWKCFAHCCEELRGLTAV